MLAACSMSLVQLGIVPLCFTSTRLTRFIVAIRDLSSLFLFQKIHRGYQGSVLFVSLPKKDSPWLLGICPLYFFSMRLIMAIREFLSSVAYHNWVTVTLNLTSDLVSRNCIESCAYLLYSLR